MSRILAALAVALVTVTAALPAKAGTCYQSCTRYGNSTTCHTNCY